MIYYPKRNYIGVSRYIPVMACETRKLKYGVFGPSASSHQQIQPGSSTATAAYSACSCSSRDREAYFNNLITLITRTPAQGVHAPSMLGFWFQKAYLQRCLGSETSHIWYLDPLSCIARSMERRLKQRTPSSCEGIHKQQHDPVTS